MYIGYYQGVSYPIRKGASKKKNCQDFPIGAAKLSGPRGVELTPWKKKEKKTIHDFPIVPVMIEFSLPSSISFSLEHVSSKG
jgi:hypothetical protein